MLRQATEVKTCYVQPQTSHIYRGKGGLRPPLGFPTPRGAASPRSHLGGRPRGREGEAHHYVGLRPI